MKKSLFNKERLPSPESYFKNQGVKLLGNGEWRSTICPFHDDSKPSLRISVKSGGFCCMACGEKGGDVLDYHRSLYGLNFVEAAKILGAWGDYE